MAAWTMKTLAVLTAPLTATFTGVPAGSAQPVGPALLSLGSPPLGGLPGLNGRGGLGPTGTG
jgi:hypothetical protein